MRRLCLAQVILGLLTSIANAQIVRFETSLGNIDLVLNPTKDSRLQEHTDNLLQYVTSGRYDGSVINRADEGFVLQMGGFKTAGPAVPATVAGFTTIEKFAGVVEGVPANTTGLSHTPGTVSLALAGLVGGGTNRDSGSSSFFVNVGNNSSLNADFTVFARVPDMTTINAIMQLTNVNLTANPGFGASPGNLGFTDVPLLSNGNLVIVSRARVYTNTFLMPGDYDGNQSLDGLDYNDWLDSVDDGAIGSGLATDGNSDGVIGIDDFDVWWRGSVTAVTLLSLGTVDVGYLRVSSVPEPSSFALVAATFAGSILTRRKRPLETVISK
jgi:cyclophilin family peptidyl-prolyl cis-trans isomerase